MSREGNMKTLLLSKTDIEQILELDAVIEAVEDGYRAFEEKRVVQPDIVSIEIPQNQGEFDFKAAYSKDTEMVTIKSASGFWNNQKELSIPNSLSTLQIFDGKSGALLCVMDASLITGYRTGAAGAISSKYLARQEASTVRLIGAGSQSRMQLRALCKVRKMKEVYVWSLSESELEPFKKEMERELAIPVCICRSPQQAVENADIIITVTPSKNPIVKAEWIRPGTHIVAVGADMEGKQELDAEIFRRAKIVNDSILQCINRGETQNPIRKGIITQQGVYGEIGEIITGKKPGRENEWEITLFDTTGMAIQDNVTAAKLFGLAVEKKLGTYFEFI